MSLAYFPMYPDDFEADTAHLTLAEDGAYNRLLRLCWRTPGCSLPADRAWIYRRMRAASDDDKAVVDTVLDEFFTLRDGRLSNARLTKEWLAGNEAHARRVKAGSKGGKAKTLKANDTGPSNAVAKPKQPEPEPEPDIREEAYASLSSGDDAPADAPTEPKPFDEIAHAVTAYNATAEASGWPTVRILSKARRSALAARLREAGGLAGWEAALSRAQASPHCCGENARGWTANFDFLTRQSSFAKLMEGNYDPRNHAGRTDETRRGSGMVAAFAAVAARRQAADGGR